MGEAILVGRSTGGSSSGGYKLVTEIYESAKTWVAPEALDQKFSVRIYVGGGAGGGLNTYESSDPFTSGGGGGGYMNNGIFIIKKDNKVSITIGSGGTTKLNSFDNRPQSGTAGGTTSFGTYLCAARGQPGNTLYGGNGGSGGGVSRGNAGYLSDYYSMTYGGTGAQFGGGAYGPGGDTTTTPKHGGCGGGRESSEYNGEDGASGICIVQYYTIIGECV